MAPRPRGFAETCTRSGTTSTSGSSNSARAASCVSTSARAQGTTASRRDWPTRTPKTTLTLLATAQTAGPAIGQVCQYLYAHEVPAGVRRILGVLALARKHGAPVVEEAAKTAVDLGVLSYRFIRLYF